MGLVFNSELSNHRGEDELQRGKRPGGNVAGIHVNRMRMKRKRFRLPVKWDMQDEGWLEVEAEERGQVTDGS